MRARSAPMQPLHIPQLQTIRFGEFLRDRHLITEEQWIAALALHWSERGARIGATIVAQGVLSRDRVELEAARFHALEVVEVDDVETSHVETSIDDVHAA